MFTHVPPALANGRPGAPIAPRTRLALPVFWIATLRAIELPTPTEPKSTGFGITVIRAPFAIPVTETLN